MFKRCFSAVGAIAVTTAALMFGPGIACAQHHDRGHGGHGSSHGGGHAGEWHGGGHAGEWPGGDRGWHRYGGRGDRHGGWYGGYYRHGYSPYYALGLGLGYPYYGGYYPYWDTYPWYPYGSGTQLYYEPRYSLYAPTYEYNTVPGYIYGTDDGVNPVRGTPTENSAHLTVRVPPDAQVWFEDQPTTQSGTVREFESPPLPPGRDYTYDIRATWQQNGREVTETRRADVHAGSDVTVDFTRPVPDEQPPLPEARPSGS